MAHELADHYRPFAHADTGDLVRPADDLIESAALVSAVVDGCTPCVRSGYQQVTTPEGMARLDRLVNWIATRDEEGLWLHTAEEFARVGPALRRAMAKKMIDALAYRLGGVPLPTADKSVRPRRVARPRQRKRK